MPKPAERAGGHGLDDTLPPFSSTKPVARTARAHAETAQIAYDVGHFDKALRLFSQAYEIDPQPNLLFDIAQCHRQLGNAERAVFFYRRYLARAPEGANLRLVHKLIEKTRQSDADRQSRERLDVARHVGEVKVLRAKEAAAKAEAGAAANEAQELRAKRAATHANERAAHLKQEAGVSQSGKHPKRHPKQDGSDGNDR
jgi:tetratricopeptide (TPR) repeat protein